jgi:flagellar protein FliT
MLSMTAQIELYEQMSALSAQMVEAAQANDWERLIVLEKSVAALREILMADADADVPAPQDAELKRALIQRILDNDAEIRRHTEPWMERVRDLLGGAARRKRLEQTYGIR